MIVNTDTRTIDFSKNPIRQLDGEIMTRLRAALDREDFFHRVILDNNRFTEDSIGLLCATIKGITTIEHISLVSCSLRDVDLMHLSNALCARKVVRHIDLSKNPAITTASVPDVARMIRVLPAVHTIKLTGTGLNLAGSEKIIAAAELNKSLHVLDLPYTVGYRVLNAVRVILVRNMEAERTSAPPSPQRARKEEPAAASPRPPDGAVRLCEERNPWGVKPLPQLVVPPLHTVPKRPAQSNELQDVDIRHLADPAVKKSTLHLLVLDKRCQLLAEHKEELRQKRMIKRGLGGENSGAVAGRMYATFERYQFNS